MSSNLVVTESVSLTKTKSPALPLAPVEYDRQYIDQLNTILRLYFNTIDNLIGQLALSTAGSAFVVPYGAFSCIAQTTLTSAINASVTTIPVVSTATFPVASVSEPKAFAIDDEIITYTGTTPTSFTGCVRGALITPANAASHLVNAPVEGVQVSFVANTAYALFLNTSDFVNDTSLTGTPNTTKMTVAKAGIYNMQFSVQVENRDNAPQDVFIWLKQNGVDIIASTGKVGIPARKGTNNPSHDIKGWNYFLSMNAGDSVEIWWSTTSIAVSIPNYLATPLPAKPSTASVVATMSFVSALPA